MHRPATRNYFSTAEFLSECTSTKIHEISFFRTNRPFLRKFGTFEKCKRADSLLTVFKHSQPFKASNFPGWYDDFIFHFVDVSGLDLCGYEAISLGPDIREAAMQANRSSRHTQKVPGEPLLQKPRI